MIIAIFTSSESKKLSQNHVLLSVNAHFVIVRATNRCRCLVAIVPECPPLCYYTGDICCDLEEL